MVAIQIKTEVIEWLMEHEGWDAEESLSFAQEFIGMLYFTGAFEPTPEVDELKLKIKARDTFLKRIGIDPQKVIVDGIDMGVYRYNDETQAY